MPGTFPSSGCQLFLLRKEERWGAVIETIFTEDGKCCPCVRGPLPCTTGVTRSTGKSCIYSSALQEETKDRLQDWKPRGLCRTCTRPAISKALVTFPSSSSSLEYGFLYTPASLLLDKASLCCSCCLLLPRLASNMQFSCLSFLSRLGLAVYIIVPGNTHQWKLKFLFSNYICL